MEAEEKLAEAKFKYQKAMEKQIKWFATLSLYNP